LRTDLSMIISDVTPPGKCMEAECTPKYVDDVKMAELQTRGIPI